jgi:uncharacterized protein (TIGR02246 family)
MIIRTVTVLILAFTTVNSAVWASERHPKVASEIEALERAWSTAFLKHDTATIARILADDFVGIDGRGVVSDKSHEIEEAKAPAAGSPAGTYVILSETLSDVRVRLYGDAAVLTAINTARISDRGEEEVVRYRRTTVYVRRSGKWQCVTFHGSRIIDPAS